MKTLLRRLLIALTFLLLATAGYLYWRLHDRYPGYEVDIDIRGNQPGRLKAGFAALQITPDVPDTWTDANRDAMFDEKAGDTWQDGNGNGKFDAVWLAGYQNNRPATGIHDPLWARVMVIDDGKTRIALVALDLIGFGADDILEIKRRIPAEWGLTYTFVMSTHTHEGPDVVGMWGPGMYQSGVNASYLQYVKDQTMKAIGDAVKAMRPARITFAQDAEGAKELVGDYREPIAFDFGLRVMHVADADADTTLGTLVQWANHPETLSSGNLEITSDFPHFLREGMEKGVYAGDSLVQGGVGGITVFVNGAIGGMMSTDTDVSIPNLRGDSTFHLPSFPKAKAQGERLALLALAALNSNPSASLDSAAIRLRVKTLLLPLDNQLYRLGAVLGIFNRGLGGPGWKIRTEVAVWQLGPAAFLHQPGELYPEIANGQTEAPEGRDFLIPPSENVPLRELMPGEYRFIIGLSNDFIGYILPLSQWDVAPPYTYGQEEAPYGEINSVGPQTAPLIYGTFTEMLKEF